jgi:hypothetical protein
MKPEYKVGDLVKHKAEFLRNTGWITNVPINGIVKHVDGDRLKVQWCDVKHAALILACNVVPYDAPDYS